MPFAITIYTPVPTGLHRVELESDLERARPERSLVRGTELDPRLRKYCTWARSRSLSSSTRCSPVGTGVKSNGLDPSVVSCVVTISTLVCNTISLWCQQCYTRWRLRDIGRARPMRSVVCGLVFDPHLRYCFTSVPRGVHPVELERNV